MAAVNKLVGCGLLTISLVAAGCSPSATKTRACYRIVCCGQAGSTRSRRGTTGCHWRIHHWAIEFG